MLKRGVSQSTNTEQIDLRHSHCVLKRGMMVVEMGSVDKQWNDIYNYNDDDEEEDDG